MLANPDDFKRAWRAFEGAKIRAFPVPALARTFGLKESTVKSWGYVGRLQRADMVKRDGQHYLLYTGLTHQKLDYYLSISRMKLEDLECVWLSIDDLPQYLYPRDFLDKSLVVPPGTPAVYDWRFGWVTNGEVLR